MGLTVHYSLTLPDHKTPRNAVEELHRLALTFGFPQVSTREHWTGAAANFMACPDDDPDRWLKIQAGASSNIHAFSIDPGEGCEQANIGLRRALPPDDPNWGWRSFCKTQYASNIGLEHFLVCHIRLVTYLEDAQNLGIVTDLNDEGNFHDLHDVAALAKEVGEWNELVAALCGQFKDTLSAPALLQAPILKHPDFEHLEARGAAKLSNEETV